MPEDAPRRPPPDERDPYLHVARGCAVRRDEIEWRFEASGGPGGQHANKAATRVVARLDLARSPSLTEAQRTALVERYGPVVAVVVDDTRSQARNRTLALERLRARLAAGLVRAAPRRPTKPSKGATERRLSAKRQRSDLKRGRRSRPTADD